MYTPSATDRQIFVDLSTGKPLSEVAQAYSISEQKCIDIWFNVSRFDRGLPPIPADRTLIGRKIKHQEEIFEIDDE